MTNQKTQKQNINIGSDPRDGRKRYEWESLYPDDAKTHIRLESIYLSILLLCAHFLIFSTWIGWTDSFIGTPDNMALTLKKYSYYASAGLLGGVAFDIKYLYRTVAKGYWHLDRRIWRIMSPFLALTVGLIVGAMTETKLIKSHVQVSGAGCLIVGFLSGYFADHAIGKMHEVATVLFGKSQSKRL